MQTACAQMRYSDAQADSASYTMQRIKLSSIMSILQKLAKARD